MEKIIAASKGMKASLARSRVDSIGIWVILLPTSSHKHQWATMQALAD